MPLLFLIFLLHSPLLAVGAAGVPPVSGTAPYWIANEGQWPGNFQFKCEVGSTIYYVTPKGMTIDFRSYVGADGNPPAPSGFDNFAERGFVGAAGVPPAVPRRNREIKGHVLQIHYVLAPQETTWSSLQARRSAHGANKLPHYSNYFLGRDSTQWRSRVSHYETIIVPEVWPGIDVEYRADKQGVETIYHAKPGADPAQIQMEYLGLDAPLRVDTQGNLVLATSLGDVKEKAPFAFHQEARIQKRIDAGFRVIGETRVVYDVGVFDAGKELVVDPLIYGTYLGGGAEDDCDVVVPASDGGVYVAGHTYALSGFPTTPGAYDETGLFTGDRLFCSRFGPNGVFIASTLFGEIQTIDDLHTVGSIGDMAYDSTTGNLWMVGYARRDSWPLTQDAYDSNMDEFGDGLILRFNEALTALEYCSYFGGNSEDAISVLELGADGRLYMAGRTYSTDFPTTPDAFSSTHRENDCFVSVYNPNSHELEFSSYFGGSDDEYIPDDIELESNGTLWLLARTESSDIPVTANAFQSAIGDSSIGEGDIMLAGISFTPATLEYCSYLGGVDRDIPKALAVGDTMIYLAGWTVSYDFPVSVGAYDTSNSIGLTGKALVSGINPLNNTYCCTFFGGTGNEQFLENTNWVHDSTLTLLGVTTSSDLPITADAYQMFLSGGSDGFIVRFDLALTNLLYSTYIGGSSIDDYASAYVANTDSLWLIGETLSIDFPTTPNAIQPGDNGLTSGFVQFFAIDTTADTTSAAEHRPIPFNFALSAYPNPFNPTTTLSFSLPHRTNVTLKIHDILGREVERVELGNMTAGQHELKVNGEAWSSGIYFATLATPTYTQTQKLLLLR